MKIKVKFLFFLLLVLAFSSCSPAYHYYYFQNTHQIPLFKEKHEYRLSGDISSENENIATNIQAAFSVTDKYAVMGSIQKFSNSTTSSENGVTDDWWTGSYFEGSFGYYKDYNNYGVFEVYSGYGNSNQHHSYTADSTYKDVTFWPLLGYDTSLATKLVYKGTSDLIFSKFYIQPQYGFSYNYFDISFSLRISDIYFNQVRNHISKEYIAFKEIESFRNHRNYFLLEPAITIRGGWKYVKLQFQIGASSILGSQSFRLVDQNFSIGINFALAKRFLK